MKKLKDEGGPAFPVEAFAAQHAPGMSLRDWFAGQAMNGLASDTGDDPLPLSHDDTPDTARRRYWEAIAATSYEIADAMLKERSK